MPSLRPKSTDALRSLKRVEDGALVAICCLALLTLLTLVGAGLGSLLGLI